MDTEDAPPPEDDSHATPGPSFTSTSVADHGAAPAEDDDDEGVPEERRRVVVIAGVAFVIIALLGFVLTRDGGSDDAGGTSGSTEAAADAGDTSTSGEAVSITGTNDTFDRADTAGGVDPLPSGASWEFINGTWDIRGGEVALVAPSATRNFMVVDVGYPDQQGQVRLAKAITGAGMTFRYQDEFHFWAIEAVPEFAALNIIKVENEAQGPEGSFGVFRKVEDVPVADGTSIGVILTGDQIQVVLDGKVVDTFEDPYLAGTGRVGLTARGTDEAPDIGDARWDDFTAGGPTGEGIIGADGGGLPAEEEGEAPPEEGGTSEPADEGGTTTTAGG